MILDTSVLIAGERGALQFESFLLSLGDEPVRIAAITASELLYGCHRATDPAIRARRLAFVDAILGLIPVIPFGLADARRHAELWAHLAAAGTMIGGPSDGFRSRMRGSPVGRLEPHGYSSNSECRLSSPGRLTPA